MATNCPKCDSENPETQSFCGNCGTQLDPSMDIPSVTKTLETPAKKLSIGTIFADRYEIREELGKGGMGEVYKVRDTKLDEDMALKLLRPEISLEKSTLERFRNELKLARKISHMNVCRMFDFHEEEGTPYITMEYVPGEDLKSLIQMKGKLSKDETLDIAKQVCEGLDVAHKLGVVHRDLKPQNIMTDESGNVKIMDFGIARSVGAEGVTEAGMIIGTPDYISPEQAEGEAADHRSDIYSLGVILYEMVTGTVPFKGDTALSVALKHKSQFPLDPRKINPDVSDDLSRLILICMEKDRAKRYQTAEALLSDLRNIEEGLPLGTKIQPRRATFIQALIRKKLFLPAMVIVLAIIAVAIWQFLPQGEAISTPKIENSIAVISFENLTGDNSNDIYQRTIPNLLITNLENTGYFYVATWERMRDILKQLDNNDVEFIDSDLGFELCRREGIGALVIGSLNKAGDMFVTDVKVYDVETKRSLKSVSSKGIGAQSIFETQIDELTREISLGMGLARERVEAAKIQLSDVTTTSPAAYDHYLKGREGLRKVDYTEAIAQFKKAVEIDPSFAMAYLGLAQSYMVQSHHEGAQVSEVRDEAITRAKEYSSKATEKERLFIEADYARFIENNRERQIQFTEQLAQKYPKEKEAFITLARYYEGKDDKKALEMYGKALDLDPNYGWTHNWLGLFYMNRGEFENALTHLKKQVEIYPDDANPLDSLAHVNFYLGRTDEALSNFEAALEIDPDFDQSMQCLPYIYAFKEDYGEAIDRTDRWMAAHPTQSVKWVGNMYKGLFYSWLGQYDEGFDYLTQAKHYVETTGYPQWIVLLNDFITAQVYREGGQSELSRALNDSWYPLFIKKYPDSHIFFRSLYFWLHGLLDLQKRNLESAKSRLAEGKSFSSEMSQSAIYLYNVLEGEILLAEGLADEAISLFENEKTRISPGCTYGHSIVLHNFPFTRDQLARAYQQKGELDKAIQEYERLIAADRTNVHYRLIHPLYYYRVALLYEQKGWEGKAIENHAKFLDLWKNADEGLPELGDARERLTGLKDQ